jgi:hypothetical protein
VIIRNSIFGIKMLYQTIEALSDLGIIYDQAAWEAKLSWEAKLLDWNNIGSGNFGSALEPAPCL